MRRSTYDQVWELTVDLAQPQQESLELHIVIPHTLVWPFPTLAEELVHDASHLVDLNLYEPDSDPLQEVRHAVPGSEPVHIQLLRKEPSPT